MRFLTSVFFAYSFHPKALIVGLKRFLKKFEFEKLFDYEVVRSSIGLLQKILSNFISSLIMKGKTDILKKNFENFSE